MQSTHTRVCNMFPRTACEFDYNGKRRAGRMEKVLTGPSGLVLLLDVFNGGFKSFSVDKIENLVITREG